MGISLVSSWVVFWWCFGLVRCCCSFWFRCLIGQAHLASPSLIHSGDLCLSAHIAPLPVQKSLLGWPVRKLPFECCFPLRKQWRPSRPVLIASSLFTGRTPFDLGAVHMRLQTWACLGGRRKCWRDKRTIGLHFRHCVCVAALLWSDILESVTPLAQVFGSNSPNRW